MYVATHPHNNSLVVLIHGVMSNRYLAWEGAIDLIQRIHADGSAPLRSYDYFAYGYKSGCFRQPPIADHFDGLRKLIGQDRYDTVALVGHSQGGVLAKLFVIEELLAGRGETLKVDLVVTLDSPHRGPKWYFYFFVIVGGIWKRLPLLSRYPLFRQFAELGIWSRNLRKLRKHWVSDYIPKDPCPATKHRRHMRSLTIPGAHLPFPPVKVVVSKKSARGFEIDQPIDDALIQRPIWGLGHGIDAMADYQQQIEQALVGHDSARIGAHAGESAAEVESELRTVLASECAPSALACEVECWTRRFAATFRGRPIRTLSFAATVKKFVSLRLRNP